MWMSLSPINLQLPKQIEAYPCTLYTLSLLHFYASSVNSVTYNCVNIHDSMDHPGFAGFSLNCCHSVLNVLLSGSGDGCNFLSSQSTVMREKDGTGSGELDSEPPCTATETQC